MKLVILLIAFHLTKLCACLWKKADIKEHSIDGQLLNSCHFVTQEKQKQN